MLKGVIASGCAAALEEEEEEVGEEEEEEEVEAKEESADDDNDVENVAWLEETSKSVDMVEIVDAEPLLRTSV